MHIIYFGWYAISSIVGGMVRSRRTLRHHVKLLRKSGYTKTSFDCDGYIITIQSRDHVEDYSA